MRGSLFCDLVTEEICTEQFPILGVHLAVQANQLQAEACIDEVLLLPQLAAWCFKPVHQKIKYIRSRCHN